MQRLQQLGVKVRDPKQEKRRGAEEEHESYVLE